MDKNHYKTLIKRYLEKKSTDEELEVFAHLTEQGKLDEYLSASMDEELERQDKEQSALPGAKVRPLWFRWQIAAAVLVTISVASYFTFRQIPVHNSLAQNFNNIKPGGNKALLTLANGSKIVLTNALNGNLANQGNVVVNKISDGQLVYTGQDKDKGEDSSAENFNTISTPKGGQYQVVLSDGTKVWLNAMSSLRYPATFRGRERNVELTGEAYFEVAKNKEMPFRVKSGIQTVRVLGTHFNVNAYADEADIKTTLLEGSVEVSAAANKQLIAPGQQSVFEMQKGALYKLNIDADKEIAWKNGVFQFDGDDIKTIMRQVSRWYNIDVAYSGEIPAVKFFGGISRGSKLSDVLKILELNEMHFERRGSSILVSYAPHQKQN